jgi:hypothetical protein
VRVTGQSERRRVFSNLMLKARRCDGVRAFYAFTSWVEGAFRKLTIPPPPSMKGGLTSAGFIPSSRVEEVRVEGLPHSEK